MQSCHILDLSNYPLREEARPGLQRAVQDLASWLVSTVPGVGSQCMGRIGTTGRNGEESSRALRGEIGALEGES